MRGLSWQLRPMADGGRRRTQRRCQITEIVRVARQNLLTEPECQENKVSVNDIGGGRECQKTADRRTVVEGVYRECLDERRKPSLAGPIPPYLGNYGMRGLQCRLGRGVVDDEALCNVLTAVDRDQDPCIEDHSPCRLARAATPSGSTGPSSEFQTLTKALKASRRARSAASMRSA